VRYGYVWNKATRSRTACPERAPIVVRIFEQVADGASPPDVARSLMDDGVPPPFLCPWLGRTIRAIINDHTTNGIVVARLQMPTVARTPKGKKRMVARPVEGHLRLDDHRTEPLVSADLWNLANAVLASRPAGRAAQVRPSDEDFLLSGIVWCGKCGRKMTRTRGENRFTPGKKVRRYRCTGNYPNLREKTGCA
jgi:hypothetical protein